MGAWGLNLFESDDAYDACDNVDRAVGFKLHMSTKTRSNLSRLTTSYLIVTDGIDLFLLLTKPY